MKKFILILLTTVLFISCDETKKVIDAAGNVQLSGTYNVVTVGGETVQNNNPYITFTALDKAINGNTGCNSFFGNLYTSHKVFGVKDKDFQDFQF